MHCVNCGLFLNLVFCLQYTLTVRADDGFAYDTAKVEIKIENVNDNPPVFLPYNKNITIVEEEIVPGCISTVSDFITDILSVLYLL
jgi:hypothetical protein